MKQNITIQQKQAHAAEVAFNGALKYKRYQEVSGDQQIEGTFYSWIYNEGQICVTYELNGVIKERCV
ncbi:hypothetical protein [Solibacillus daqui]|uniref:hypothetical protein n=1 Tax=Solibacillus daqui TaxID=2912187 RepID=UPI0023672892|nr:hypothetical protein [Solibacillus daqui]